jgi:hypothetical protein
MYKVITSTYRLYNQPSDEPDCTEAFDDLDKARANFEAALDFYKGPKDYLWTLELAKVDDDGSVTIAFESNEQ